MFAAIQDSQSLLNFCLLTWMESSLIHAICVEALWLEGGILFGERFPHFACFLPRFYYCRDLPPYCSVDCSKPHHICLFNWYQDDVDESDGRYCVDDGRHSGDLHGQFHLLYYLISHYAEKIHQNLTIY
jgi:hypothetical protein